MNAMEALEKLKAIAEAGHAVLDVQVVINSCSDGEDYTRYGVYLKRMWGYGETWEAAFENLFHQMQKPDGLAGLDSMDTLAEA